MKDYNGILLENNEFEIMTKLEKLVGQIPNKQYDEPIFYGCDHGFQAKSGKIEVLAIPGEEIGFFPKEIPFTIKR